MTGPRDLDEGMTQPNDPPSDQYWPARDLRDQRRVEMSEADQSVQAGPEWDVRRLGERRRSTTAEQAVPWLIAIILALAGMVIVLLAMIYTNGGALSGLPAGSPVGIVNGAEPSGSGVASGGSGVASGVATPQATPSAGATPSNPPTATATPAPTYPPLEMTYLSRNAASSPVYLFRRDFAVKVDPRELATADQGIAGFAWAPDGTVGAALIGGSTGRVVAIEPDSNKRALIDGADEIAFGQDASTLYAVKISTSGGTDKAEVLSIDFASGDTKSLTDFSYPHPQIVADPLLTEAAFDDEGGIVRLYATSDGNLVLWILGAPATYRIDPSDGTRTEVTRTPTLWSPEGMRRIEAKVSGSSTTLTLSSRDEKAHASVKVSGLVSHLRWSANGSEVAYTLGHLGRNGGVSQDLYVWALNSDKAPLPITSNGTSFGAEWLGASQSWEP